MKEFLNQTTGRLIAFHRKAKNVKQEEFALTLGISQSKVSDWENDHKSPTVDDIRKIANLLDIHPYLLIPVDEHSSKNNVLKTNPVVDSSIVESQAIFNLISEVKFFYQEILTAKNQTIEILKQQQNIL